MLQLKQETGGDRESGRSVFGGLGGPSLSRRLRQAAEAAGIAKHMTSHSGRGGLAVELTQRGASTHDVMHAANRVASGTIRRFAGRLRDRAACGPAGLAD